MLKSISTPALFIAVVATGMYLDVSIVRASYFGDAPFCVVTYGDGSHWNCEFRTGQECVAALAGGIRVSCNVNPYYTGRSTPATGTHAKSIKKRPQR